ncbi:transcription factor Adf-1-like [Nylanderia fulva]|uniref:transcription factor Adf-1-like n=1 Tax=Nylanderia fulva TaxID=613905 RepID=UPI0010FB32E9|nr:transcription factor Adf-1-like [Nylanderia fulva]
MSINDTLLIECVRAHPEIYDKGHAGFKNSGIKDSAWKIVGETLNASATDCTARWHTLRERFAKEKRIFEQEGKSGAAASTRPEWALYSVMSFLTPHIRKRKSVDNFQTKALVSKTTPSPDEEIIINEQAVDINSAPFIISTCSTLSPLLAWL